jgi:hypothetical protein
MELESLKGTGSVASTTTDTGGSAGNSILSERIDSVSTITQTRLTAGYSRDLSKEAKLGVFYRYAFIQGDDHDVDHSINGLALGLNGTRTTGHSSEFGWRLRGTITPRLSYGLAGAWLGISAQDGLIRSTAVDSHARDRAQRGSLAAGLGYALTRRAVLSFDLAGGGGNTSAARIEDATGKLLQNEAAENRFVSMHTAIQVNLSRRLFASASLLNLWQDHQLEMALYSDRFGGRALLQDSFFALATTAYQTAPRFSDFGAGWRFSRDVFAQYVYSTAYGAGNASHTLMVRYTFRLGPE